MADFDEIEIHGAGKLEAEIGPLSPVTVTTDDNLLPLIETTVHGRTFVIKELQEVQPRAGLSFKLTAPNVKSIEVNGAAVVHLSGVKNDSLSVVVNGTSDIELAGETGKLDFHVRGSGSLQAVKLKATRVNAAIDGTANAEVNAVEELKARVSGVGNISYVGDPKVEQQINGLGRVSRKR